jgi:antirestriction protein ArdC
MLDPVAVERAEKSLDEFINSRSKAKEKANAEEDLWRISERIHLEKLRRENAAAWRSYHLGQAERLEQTAAALAASHRQRAAKLGPDPGPG